jgi:integrase
MARSIRSSTLETRSTRLKLPVSGKPVFVRVAKQLGLGYRRNKSGGVWVMRVADGRRGNWIRAIGAADDHEEANGTSVLDFWQAQDMARSLARKSLEAITPSNPASPITVEQALASYEGDLQTRGNDIANVARVRTHMTGAVARKMVAHLTSRDLRGWRDDLAKTVAPATVNRICSCFKAALNLAAGQDEQIVNRRAWEFGLALIPNANQSRNVILADDVVRNLIAEAYNQSPEFGLLVELAAITGARVSQIGRLEVQDLQVGPAPRLMMPASRKGKGTKAILRRPVPIPPSLTARLTATDRSPGAPLITRPNGTPWKKHAHSVLFARAVTGCGLDPAEVTIYALRHSSIVRQLLAGVPVRVVAAGHDTSVTMIERTYSRYIGDHADALARGAILDMAPADKPKLTVVG